MVEAESERGDLEGWPTLSLEAAGIRKVTEEAFYDLIVHGATEPGAYAVETGPGGSVEPRLVSYSGRMSRRSRGFLRTFLRNSSLRWDAEHLVLVNEPCFIAVASGAILLADGRIVLETLFPTEDKTIEACVGGGLRAANLAGEMRKATEINDRIWAPLFSLGSSVYGHAVAESMVQDAALYRLHLSPWISYAATEWPVAAQEMVIAQAHSQITKFRSLLVKVPRVIFASKLYRHLPLGHEFRRFVARAKVRCLFDATPTEPPGDKVYVSRLGISGRRLTNEAALIEQLSNQGFRIVSGERLSFEEQVRSFRGARLIVGPYGSGLINSAFASSNATLCELRSLNNPDHSPNWDDFYFGLAATMQYSYGVYVVDNRPYANTWTCDIPDVLEFLDAASAGATAKRVAERRRAGPAEGRERSP